MAEHTIYEIEAQLNDFKPTIRRRFIINGERSLAYLGYTLMAMFEMSGSHLFEFNGTVAILKDYSKKITFAIPTPDDPDPLASEIYNVFTNKIKTSLRDKDDTLNFVYDYGDAWEISLTVVNVEKKNISLQKIPFVSNGDGFGIIENIGGTHGLEDYTQAMKAGKGEAFDMYHNWLGDNLPDMDHFDLDYLNYYLKNEVGFLKRQYENADWT